MEDHPKLAELPDKPSFKIGEVADFLGVKPYILKYWEGEFDLLKPQQENKGQHRKYSREDVNLLLHIQRLVHEEMFTIQGARRHLEEQLQGLTPTARPTNERAMGEDPLAGAGLDAMELRLHAAEARMEQLQADRDRAWRMVSEANAALREVEAAREQTERDRERVQAELEASNEAHQAELSQLHQRIAELELALSHASAPVTAPTPAPTPAPAPTPSLVPAQLAALEAQEAALQDLRNKLRYQLSNRQRVLRELRAQTLQILELVQTRP